MLVCLICQLPADVCVDKIAGCASDQIYSRRRRRGDYSFVHGKCRTLVKKGQDSNEGPLGLRSWTWTSSRRCFALLLADRFPCLSNESCDGLLPISLLPFPSLDAKLSPIAISDERSSSDSPAPRDSPRFTRFLTAIQSHPLHVLTIKHIYIVGCITPGLLITNAFWESSPVPLIFES